MQKILDHEIHTLYFGLLFVIIIYLFAQGNWEGNQGYWEGIYSWQIFAENSGTRRRRTHTITTESDDTCCKNLFKYQ